MAKNGVHDTSRFVANYCMFYKTSDVHLLAENDPRLLKGSMEFY